MVESKDPTRISEDVSTLQTGLMTAALGKRWVRIAIQLVTDVAIISLSYVAAFWLRLDSISGEGYTKTLLHTFPLVLIVSVYAFKFGGIYRQIWQLAHAQSVVTIIKSVLVAAAASWVGCLLIGFDPPVPRSIFPIFSMLSVILIGASRFFYRYLSITARRVFHEAVEKEDCLIYGAGVAGDFLVRHIASNPRFPYRAVGFVDDDTNKRDRRVQNLKVYGGGADLSEIRDRCGVKTVLIAMHAVPGKTIREIVERCHANGLKPLIVPDIASSLGNEVFRPRDVDIRDLLRRSPKLIEHDVLRSFFQGEVVLVSGAGGSIGSEICRQVLELEAKRLIMLDSSEFNLYKIEAELEQRATSYKTDCQYILGSTIDDAHMDRIFEAYKPTLVLHAAAYKHVPIIERNPLQGVINNVLGTRILSEKAVKYGVKKFLLVSTDKAVRPTNIMGATKRCCELLVQAMHGLNNKRTGFCAVRFGNVLGSSGSVVPRFLEQIQAGGPITVTHTEVTRYFMLVSEAVALVLQAISLSKGGEVFVLDMGEPVKIYDMAKQLIMLAGKVPGRDIEIAVTGLRPGEKLYEELIIEASEAKQVYGDLYIAFPDPVEPATMLELIDKAIKLAEEGNESESLGIVRSLAQFMTKQRGENGETQYRSLEERLH